MGMGIGDWGLGPIPNPQSPIPNPQSPYQLIRINNYLSILKNNNKKNKIKISTLFTNLLINNQINN